MAFNPDNLVEKVIKSVEIEAAGAGVFESDDGEKLVVIGLTADDSFAATPEEAIAIFNALGEILVSVGMLRVTSKPVSADKTPKARRLH